MDATLISTKFHLPEGAQDRVVRPRLIQQINAHLSSRKLTLIAASAGSGKTTLIRDWYDQNPNCHLAWLALDEDDNDPVRMLRYLFASIHHVSPHIRFSLEGIHSVSRAQIKELLTVLLNQVAQQSERLVLALDDYHVIEHADVHFILTFLLDYMPDNLHLMLTTRSDPPLPLARLRTRRQLLEIRMSDLRFTIDETRQFLTQVMGFQLTNEQIKAIENRTEGWIAGIQLAALSMRDKQDIEGFIKTFAGSNRYIMDYLLEEVFGQLNEAMRHFLLCTSIVEPFCASLCEVLTDHPHSSTMIDQLVEWNLFIIPLDEDRTWYRYHHLFADLLRSRLLRQYSLQEQQSLYARASAWYEQQGLLAQAIDYAITGQNWQDAVRLLERHSDYFWFRGELKRLLQWSDRLPGEIVDSSIALCVLKAWTMLPSGELDQMDPYLTNAEKALRNDKENIWYGRILSLRAFMVRIRQGGEVGHELTLKAKAHIASEDHVWQAFNTMNLSASAMMRGDLDVFLEYNHETRTLSKMAGDIHTYLTSSALRAQVDLDRGHFTQAEQIFQQMQLALDQYYAQQSPLAGFAHVVAGRLAYEKNDLDTARHHFDLALQFGQDGEVADIIIDGLIWSARVRQVTGQIERSGQYLTSLREFVSDIHVDWTHQIVDAYDVYQHLLIQDWDAIYGWVAANHERIKREPIVLNWWFHTQHFCLIRAYIALKQYDNAYHHIAHIRTAAQQYGERSVLLARLDVLQVLVFIAQNRRDLAIKMMRHILDHAPVNSFCRWILDDLEALQPVLLPIIDDYRILRQWIQDSQSLTPSRLTHPELLDPLSERELEVLAQLPYGLSNQEMAEKMYVSINTIKWHLKEIYSKLGVSNRTQAIEKARGLQIIS